MNSCGLCSKVAGMQAELVALQPQLIKTVAEVEALMGRIAHDKQHEVGQACVPQEAQTARGGGNMWCIPWFLPSFLHFCCTRKLACCCTGYYVSWWAHDGMQTMHVLAEGAVLLKTLFPAEAALLLSADRLRCSTTTGRAQGSRGQGGGSARAGCGRRHESYQRRVRGGSGRGGAV